MTLVSVMIKGMLVALLKIVKCNIYLIVSSLATLFSPVNNCFTGEQNLIHLFHVVEF